MNLIETLNESLLSCIQASFNLTLADCTAITCELNTDEDKQPFGDISCNAALVLAKKVGKNPRAIAQTISEDFKSPLIERIEIAGPGFINFFLTQDAFVTIAQEIATQKSKFFQLDARSKKITYSLEFVSANPTGPLHLGHGRGGIIGDVLGNVLNFLGHNVTKEYYINDAGSQMKKLGDSFKIRCLQLLGDKVEIPEEGYHGTYLVTIAEQCYATHGEKLRTFDDDFFTHYAENHILAMIRKTLTDYGIIFNQWFSERTLHEGGAITAALEKLKNHGYTYQQDGALWFKSTEFGDDKDRVLQKQDGSLTYAAADVAYMLNKIERGAEKLIFVLGQDHHSYVVRLKGILAALSYDPAMLDVILYQLVTITEGSQQVRMSKRAGKMVTLEDVIETVGKDVARFFYLNRKADAHLEFDLELALKKTDENPVYYLQYAYVRTNSILEKANEIPGLEHISDKDAVFMSHEERLLLKKIVSLKSLLETISHNYQTHILTYYMLELAQMFHRYYSKNRVIDAAAIDQSRGRLLLVQEVKQTFDICLELIGISRPERM